KGNTLICQHVWKVKASLSISFPTCAPREIVTTSLLGLGENCKMVVGGKGLRGIGQMRFNRFCVTCGKPLSILRRKLALKKAKCSNIYATPASEVNTSCICANSG